jgi:hypothetical protein
MSLIGEEQSMIMSYDVALQSLPADEIRALPLCEVDFAARQPPARHVFITASAVTFRAPLLKFTCDFGTWQRLEWQWLFAVSPRCACACFQLCIDLARKPGVRRSDGCPAVREER